MTDHCRQFKLSMSVWMGSRREPQKAKRDPPSLFSSLAIETAGGMAIDVERYQAYRTTPLPAWLRVTRENSPS